MFTLFFFIVGSYFSFLLFVMRMMILDNDVSGWDRQWEKIFIVVLVSLFPHEKMSTSFMPYRPTSLTPGCEGLNGCGRGPGGGVWGCNWNWGCAWGGRARFWGDDDEDGWLSEGDPPGPPDGPSSSSSSGAAVVGGGSHPATVCASSHLILVGVKASPAGHRCNLG